MEKQKQDGFLVALARLLTGRHAVEAVLDQALSLFCDCFDFDASLFYESDSTNTLHLTHACGSKDSFLPPALFPSMSNVPMHQPLLYSGFDSMLFSALGVASGAVIFISNQGGEILGLVTLCNGKKITLGDKNAEMDIKAGLSMLANYIAVPLYQSRLGTAQGALESILDNTGIDIYVNDFYTHEILYVNKSMAAPYGGQDKFFHRKCWQVLFPNQTGPCEFCPQNKLIDSQGNPSKIYTWDYQRAFDGSWFRVFSAAFRWIDGRIAHVVSSADISDNKRNEALVEYLANYDPLTKLPNRRMLVKACEERIHNATQKKTYVLFFDIDGFKKINDSLGHDAGDEFLVQLGAFFSSIPMLKDVIFRNGGDEFVAILDEDMTEDDVRSLAQRIHNRFANPWLLKKGEVYCNTSIGVSQYPTDGISSEELLHKADQAMYAAKKIGGGSICVYGEERR